MRNIRLGLVACFIVPLSAQTICPPTLIYQSCDLVFELTDAEIAAHPNPYLSVKMHAEVRSPKHTTFKLPAFWDGGKKLIIRFSPVDPGQWDFRITSNLARFDGKLGQTEALDSEVRGFIKPANLRHWAYTETNKPHLWMGDTMLGLATMERAKFEAIVNARSEQKFNHIRAQLFGSSDADAKAAYPDADKPNPDYFRELEQRIQYVNKKGITVDLMLGRGQNQLRQLFPTWQQRERFLQYIIGRYSSMNVSWLGLDEYESYTDGRPLLKELGDYLKKNDPYNHPRSTFTEASTAGLLSDGWMSFLGYQSFDSQLCGVERQLYTRPFVNFGVGSEDSGAGKTGKTDTTSDEFRKRLWNITMDGHYPTFANTGISGIDGKAADPKFADSPGAKTMKAWYDFFDWTRHWELDPYFDVDGGRALALEGEEYIVYLEKPGLVEVIVEKHGYDVYWFNPITGESIKLKNFKGEKFVGEPPTKTQDWVLHLSRDGHKERLQSYKFESRPAFVQEVEMSIAKVPFEIVSPKDNEISTKKSYAFELKIKKDTRATRLMQYVWTAEVVADGQGSRVLATGSKGTFRIPAGIIKKYPAVLNVHVSAINANGKAYAADQVYRVVD